MATQKNQHYVPRCALRLFTSQMEGRAINLFNIEAKKSIQNAPVKGQCSRDYFYGKDLRAENILARLEGHYARIASLLIHECQITAEDENWLRLFVVVQTRRTEGAIRELELFSLGMTDAAFKSHPDQRPPALDHAALVKLSVGAGVKLHDYMRDLKFIILRNRTELEFITSDHPAVISNKFSFEKLGDKKFGMSNSGVFLVLPISPKLTAFFFDLGVYTVAVRAF